MYCHNCGSEHTSTFEMTYAGGTTQGSFNGAAVSFGVTDGAWISGRTSSQTHLAARCAPPSKPSVLIVIIPAVISMCFMPLLIGGAADSMLRSTPRLLHWLINLFVIPVVLAQIAIVLFVAGRYYRNRQAVWRQAINDWCRSWVCLRCGAMWRV